MKLNSVKFYDAYKHLNFYLVEDEKAHLINAYKKAKTASVILKQFSTELNSFHSRLIKTEIKKPIKTLSENLESRLLPRILKKENISEMQDILLVLAEHFSEAFRALQLEDVISQNKELEKYGPIELEEPPNRLRNLSSLDSVKLIASLVFSFVIIMASLWIHSIIFNTNSFDLLENPTTFLTFIIGVFGIGGVIFTYIRKKSIKY